MNNSKQTIWGIYEGVIQAADTPGKPILWLLIAVSNTYLGKTDTINRGCHKGSRAILNHQISPQTVDTLLDGAECTKYF